MVVLWVRVMLSIRPTIVEIVMKALGNSVEGMQAAGSELIPERWPSVIPLMRHFDVILVHWRGAANPIDAPLRDWRRELVR